MSEPKTAEWYAHKIANDEDCEGMAAYGWALKWVREAIAQGQREERERHSEPLWKLLDDIDTLSDMLKPEQTPYYKAVMKECAKRNKHAQSPDGHNLVWESD